MTHPKKSDSPCLRCWRREFYGDDKLDCYLCPVVERGEVGLSQPKLTKTDYAKIERWAMAYLRSKPHGVSYWDRHGNDSLTYQKICKLANIEPRIGREKP